MVAVGRPGPPELVQIAGMAARGREHHIPRAGCFPNCADHFALRGLGRGCSRWNNRSTSFSHASFNSAISRRVVAADFYIRQRGSEFFERHPRIGDHRNRADFVGIELRRIDIDKTHVGILECGHGGRGKIRVTGANADDQVRLTRETIGRERACRADCAHALRMILGQGAFARLRLGDGDAGLAANVVNAAEASLNKTPPPATINGLRLRQSP